jgi:RND superfamily putative drug exporter
MEALARWLHAHARPVLGFAVLGAVVAGIFGFSVAGRLSPYGVDDPATQSVQVRHRFAALTKHQIDPGVIAVVRTRGVRSPAGTATVRGVARKLARGPDIARVVTYLQTHDPRMVSRDGRDTYLLGYFKAYSDKRIADDAQQIERSFASQHYVLLDGTAIANAEVNSHVTRDLTRAELFVFPLVFLLSFVFFRSLVAALLPPLIGGLAIIGSFMVLRFLSGAVDLSVFALNLVTGAGLGLAIDYCLLIVSRWREEAAANGFGKLALARTLQTAGRTVIFSAVTVTAAIAALLLFPQRFLYSMGYGGVIVVPLAAMLAVVVLPAVLVVLGPRVNALAPKRLQRAAARDARPDEQGPWYRLSRWVMRRPAQIAVVSAAALIALGIPFTGIRFTFVDEFVLPGSAGAHRAGDLIRREFPRGQTNPLDVLAGVPAGSPRAATFAAQMRRLPGVASVGRPAPAGRSHSLIELAPTAAPLSAADQRLVHRVRSLREPFHFGVAGQTAAFVDLKHSLGTHLPLVLGVIVAATLMALFLMTGSVVLPIKAVVMNVLTLSAAFGLLVLIFQDGRLQGLLGYRSQGALEITDPVLVFAIAFGLATDYGVFLLSRIKEAHDQGLSNAEAVATGLERTGRIVTAAAILFAVAIGSFVTSSMVFIKELGLGIAFAVLIDASLVRALLVPSLMALLGRLNWWAPGPLRRVYERIGLHEAAPPSASSSYGAYEATVPGARPRSRSA